MKSYYHTHFAEDVRAFLGTAPLPYFGHAWRHHCREQLSRVPKDRHAQFVVCLYFTVLVDQAMHAHYPARYAEFERVTRYPKFCFGLSQFQHNPRDILFVPADLKVTSPQAIRDVLPEGMTLFVEEVIGFFRDHMPDIDAGRFFRELLEDSDVLIPGIIVILSPHLRNEVDYVAYEELQKAVDRAFPTHAQ